MMLWTETGFVQYINVIIASKYGENYWVIMIRFLMAYKINLWTERFGTVMVKK